MATVQVNEETILQIVSTLGQIKSGQESLRNELIGNGQPGRVGRAENDIIELRDRVQKQENKAAWLNGAFVTAGAGIHFILHKLGL